MSMNARTEVCDYWNRPAKCPSGATCHKLHGDEARPAICRYVLSKGICLSKYKCRFAHPKPVPVEDTSFVDGLDVSSSRNVNYAVEVSKSEDFLDFNERRDLASFNWDQNKPNEIVVPGMPKILDPPEWPQIIDPDHKLKQEMLQAGFPPSEHALEPLLRAVLALNPNFAPRHYELISNHANLRNLLGIARGVELKDFRVDVEIRDQTVLLSSWTESMAAENVVTIGRGKQFVNRVTKEVAGFDGVRDHRQIVTYNLGGMDILVQVPVDAFNCHHNHHMQEQEETNSFEKSSQGEITVIRRGKMMNMTCLVMTWTTDVRNENEDYELADLWIMGHTQVYAGKFRKEPIKGVDWRQAKRTHEANGVFDNENVSLRDMSVPVMTWNENHPVIYNFAQILRKVHGEAVDMSRQTGHTSLALVFEAGTQTLKIYSRTDGKVFVPKNVASLWAHPN